MYTTFYSTNTISLRQWNAGYFKRHRRKLVCESERLEDSPAAPFVWADGINMLPNAVLVLVVWILRNVDKMVFFSILKFCKK